MSRWSKPIAGSLGLALLIFALIMPGLSAYADAGSRTITGKVVSISREAKTIALDTGDGNSTVRAFDLAEGVAVTMGGEKASLDDIHTGDVVTIRYHQDKEGLDIIDGIAIEVQPGQHQV